MENRKVFQDSVTPLPTQSGLTPSGLMVQAANQSHLDDVLPVLFSLSITDEQKDDLEQKVSSGAVMSTAEINKNYGSNHDDLQSLETWLKGEGYDITKISANGTSVYTKASVKTIQKSLQVNMVRVTKDGLGYTAAQNAPSLPSDIGECVHAIIGLQPFRQVKKNYRMRVPKHGNRTADGANDSSVHTPGGAIQNAPPYFLLKF